MSDDPVDDPLERVPSGPDDSEEGRKLPRYTSADLTRVVDEFGRDHFWTPDGRPVCGRLRKEKNRVIESEACLAPPMTNGACRVHGGQAGAPIRHGRYSRVMKSLRAAFEGAHKDQELLDSTRDIALMDVLNEQLVERLEELDCPAWRDELRAMYSQLRAAIRGQRQAEVAKLMKELGDLIDRGATADQLARDLLAQVDKRANRACKLTELQLRREEKVTASELTAVMAQFLGVLERELEPAVYHQVLPELRRVTGPGQLERGA